MNVWVSKQFCNMGKVAAAMQEGKTKLVGEKCYLGN